MIQTARKIEPQKVIISRDFGFRKCSHIMPECFIDEGRKMIRGFLIKETSDPKFPYVALVFGRYEFLLAEQDFVRVN